MVDIHCHLIPNVDDGPKSWEESLGMARLASEDGIKYAFATPHWLQGSRMAPSPELIREKVEHLNRLVSGAGLDYRVFPGMEIGMCENLPSLLEAGKVLPLGDSNYILIETPFISIPLGMGKLLFSLKSIGINPVLAHPERNMNIQRKPGIAAEMVEKGALLQINASSLCGGNGEGAKRCSVEFAKMGLIHALASDGHSTEWRPPKMSDGIRALAGIVGDEGADELVRASLEMFVDSASN